MSDLYKAFIVAALSLVVALISYRYQFRRNRLIDFKGRMRYLHTLIKETVNLTEHALVSIHEVVAQLEKNNLYMPLLPITAYPIAKYLQDKVLTDDYFIAYINAYTCALDAEDHFYQLKYNAVFIHVQYEQLVQMSADAVLRDNERRKDYIERYKNTSAIIEGLNTYTDPKIIAYRKKFADIERNYINNREPNDKHGNILEVESKYVEPLFALLGQDHHVPNELLPLMLHLGDMYTLFKDIQFQNDNMRDEFLELSSGLKTSLEIVEKVYKYLTTPQVMNLIK